MLYTIVCYDIIYYTICMYLKFKGLDFERTHHNIVVNTSRDHLLIQDYSRLSIDISGIVSRKTVGTSMMST